MKKIILDYNNYILYVYAADWNTTIYNSKVIKKTKDMKRILHCLRQDLSEVCSIHTRSMFSMINEWRAHNLLHFLGIIKDKTKDVDFEATQPWYLKLLYFLLSPLYLHF